MLCHPNTVLIIVPIHLMTTSRAHSTEDNRKKLDTSHLQGTSSTKIYIFGWSEMTEIYCKKPFCSYLTYNQMCLTQDEYINTSTPILCQQWPESSTLLSTAGGVAEGQTCAQDRQ